MLIKRENEIRKDLKLKIGTFDLWNKKGSVEIEIKKFFFSPQFLFASRIYTSINFLNRTKEWWGHVKLQIFQRQEAYKICLEINIQGG